VGQQIAFIIIIVLSGMIFTQILMFRNDFREKYDSLYRELSKLRSSLGKDDSL